MKQEGTPAVDGGEDVNSHLALIKQRLDQLDIDYLYLDGSTPAAQRQKLVETFQKGEMSLFLISLKAGGSGLNLTAADYIIHLDPWWNPAVEDQATDRAYRIGQKNPVTIYKLITIVVKPLHLCGGYKTAIQRIAINGKCNLNLF